MQNGILTLRGRAAWVHNFNTHRNVDATFQACDPAPVTGSAEMKWLRANSPTSPPAVPAGRGAIGVVMGGAGSCGGRLPAPIFISGSQENYRSENRLLALQ
jgi:hypothetical protein